MLFSREMAITFLYSFVAAVSTMTVAVNAQVFAPLQFAGVNIAGFGEYYTCITTRHIQTAVLQTSVAVQMALALSQRLSPLSTNYPVGFILENPHTILYVYLIGVDGLGQMQHFYNDDGYNVFRLPVGWQYLTYNQSTSVLNETQFSNYNMLVSDCLSTGAHCEIDIHNYARYDGEVSDCTPVIVNDAQFDNRLSVKVAQATKYSPRYGTISPRTGRMRQRSFLGCMCSPLHLRTTDSLSISMNEPHDIPVSLSKIL
jgi:hypothetical protein